MSNAWLDIVGIGEDGVDGLSADALARVSEAEVIIGGDRHHKLAPNPDAKRIAWPSPFDAMIDEIRSHKGRRIVILVTGDPLWFSVGARILKAIPAEEVRFFPQLSAFQWAACRMGWSLADCDTVTVHGRAVEQIIPHFAPRARLFVLTRDGDTPREVAALLCKTGYSRSRISVLSALGGRDESRMDGIAENWSARAPDFHTLAIECVADEGLDFHSRSGGLPDAAFVHDGQLTKQAVRAVTLSSLAPFPDAVLWDVGAGCGSVAVEWMRASRGAVAHAVEPDEGRCDMIRKNAVNLGVPKLNILQGSAPDKLEGLPRPDAIFIGGGLTTDGVFEACWNALRPGGRLVANAVTVESEVCLGKLHGQHGGNLVRLGIQTAEPVGRFRGWKPAMPVTQWSVVK